jgi:hypothetical protein
MAKITIDTNEDSLDELEHAVELIQKAISRKNQSPAIAVANAEAKTPSAQDLVEEAAIETPFLKVSFSSNETVNEEGSPTVDDLLNSESITDDELQELYKSVPGLSEQFAQRKEKEEDTPQQTNSSDDSFIEIVEFDDDH